MALFQLDAYRCDSHPQWSDLLYRSRLYHIGKYTMAFRLRNPVFYYLWYRWLFYAMLTKEERQYVRRTIKPNDPAYYYSPCAHQQLGASLQDIFCLYHPLLFLPVSIFQLIKELATRPSEIVRSPERQVVCPQTAVNSSVNNEFAGEHNDVPKSETGIE